ncbi:MAG: DUF4917 family protein [Candidatus Hodarchaeales archaeon]
MELKSYQDIIQHLNKTKRTKHLLLGNGFSMAYDAGIFSYNALNKFIEKSNDNLLKKLFEIVNTKNFELIMQQLDNFCQLAEEFSSDKKLRAKIQAASETLKTSLLDAIKELHPEHVFKIPEEKSKSCAKFINTFLGSGGHVFTSNYDILLYWVLMRNMDKIANAIDGFGRYAEESDEYQAYEDLEFSDLEWGKHRDEQNIHYLHGALPLFDAGISIVKEEYDTQDLLLEKIKKRIANREYPIFVTAGDGKEKLTHIMHNQYLSHCYDQLSSLDGSLVTFGFNFGKHDEHIIDAINIAAKHRKKTPPKLWSIYIGVYSKDDKKYIESIAGKFKCKVNLYDSKTVNVWDQKDN